MSKKKNKDPIVYRGLQCDSIGEFNFILWMEELEQTGFINSFKRGDSYLLSDALINNYAINLKTRSKPAKQTILAGHSYTLDFVIEWNLKAKGIFYSIFGEKVTTDIIADSQSISYIENKPIFDFNNMGRLATINVKWLYVKHGIYANVVKNDYLFKNTFVPQKLLINKNGTEKKHNFKVRTLEQYLNLVK